MTPDPSNLVAAVDPIKQPACVDLQSLQSNQLVDNAQTFELGGWKFMVRSQVVSLGQLASADYYATCGDLTRDIRVLLIRHGETWQIEKVAPTK